MAQPVVHFEIIGKEPAKLRSYFGELFGWEFDTSSPVAEAVSEPDDYGFVNRNTTSEGTGIPGGVGGGSAYTPHALFYVGVPDVEAALQKAEELGGVRRMGPERAPGRDLVVGQSGCLACHVIGANGNNGPGPNLTHVGSRLPMQAIASTLINPTAPMPSFKNLPPQKFQNLVGFLAELQ